MLVTITIFALLARSYVTSTLCPVLQSYSDQPLFYGYPVDMLLPSTLADNPKATFRNCSSRNFYWPSDIVLKCAASAVLCAVTEQNVNTAMNVADWPQYAEGLRRIQGILERKEKHTAKIYIIGGSMTRGSVTYSACVCDRIVHNTCPHNSELKDETTCAWPTMFEHWISRAFPGVEVHSLAKSGMNSRMMADNFADYLRHEANVSVLTNDDIVIIDHSVNDAMSLPDPLRLGFESLIRRILHLALDGARPTIVVMEQHPVGSFLDKPLVPNYDYAAIYRDVSRHYGLIHISLREVSWTYLNFTTTGALNTTTGNIPGQVVVNGVPMVRMYPIAVEKDKHPPWWRHLFVADVLADSLLHIMSSLHSKHNSLYVMNNTSTKYTMPASLYDLSKASSAVCDNAQPFVLDVYANATFTPADVRAYETDPVTVPKAGWREYIDYHNTPGFIINALSDPTQRVLSFPLAKRSTYQRLMLKIVYLKSYTGMGLVYVHLCGEKIFEFNMIDGLYHDHATYKVSLPTEYIIKIPGGDNTRCLSMSAKKRTLDIVYTPVNDAFRKVRNSAHQKFKLMSVQICVAAPLV